MSRRFDRLTRPAIRALAPGQSINEHGITATRLRNGDVRYSVNVMVDGERVHRVIGRESDGVTREQAERAAETFKTRAREGRLDLPRARKTHRSFAEAAEDYLTRLEEIGGKGLDDKRRHLRQSLIPHFGTLRADKVSSFAVKGYAAKRAKTVKPATVNRELSTLSHMMNRLADWRWIKPEDRPKIEKAAEPRKAIAVLSDRHIEQLMQSAIADQDGRTWLFVAFGLNTAMRHSEILRARYDRIDFDSRRLFIPQAKAGEREQPLTASLCDMLKRQQGMEADPTGWIFPATTANAKREHRGSMAKQFQRAVIRAGLDPAKVTPHVMRHTAITRLIKAGVDLPTVQKISGHKTLAMVMRYAHIHGQHIDTAIEALSTAFPDTITPELHAQPKQALQSSA